MARRATPVVTIDDIATGEGLTRAYVAKLMRLLRRGGVVTSQRGNTGGYRLTRPAKELTLNDALAPLGSSLFPESFCRDHRGRKRICVHQTDCSIRALWRTVDRVALRCGAPRCRISSLQRPASRSGRGGSSGLTPTTPVAVHGLRTRRSGRGEIGVADADGAEGHPRALAGQPTHGSDRCLGGRPRPACGHATPRGRRADNRTRCRAPADALERERLALPGA
jgi:Rrf2 family protein